MSKILSLSILLASAFIATAGVIISPAESHSAKKEQDVIWSDADPSDDNACTIHFAANELQHYLRQITSNQTDWDIIKNTDESQDTRQIELRLIPDSNVDPPIGTDGFIIKTTHQDSGWKTIIGASNRIGLLYGSYEFLHSLGVRWYAPGKDGEIVPISKLERIPEGTSTQRPDYFLRGFHAWEDRGGTAFLLWMARNRMNYWCLEESNKALLNKLGIRLVGGEHLLHLWYLGGMNPYPYNHAEFEGDDDKKPDPYAVSDTYQGDRNGDGKLSNYEAHPEWYGLVKGKRVSGPRSATGHGSRHGVNFCTSNEDAMSEFMKNAVQDLIDGRLKDTSIVNAWLIDVATWCECQHCKKLGTPTDRYLQFINRYDKAIKEAQKKKLINREITLLFLTYKDVVEPPSKPLPKDFDYTTCIANFFPINRCYVHHLQDDACDINSRFDGILHGWTSAPGRHYRGQLCIGEYYNISRFKNLPISFMTSMKPDIPYYHEVGARMFHYMHVPTKSWGNKALTNYQLGRQLWDTKLDVDQLWGEYFSKRYGPVASEMREFYQGLEDMLANVNELKVVTGPALNKNGKSTFVGTSHLSYDKSGSAPSLLEMRESGAKNRQLINRILSKDLPPPVRQRIEEDERLFLYGERTLAFYDFATQGHLAASRKKVDKAKAALEKLKEVSDQLWKDKTSATFAGEHASSPNALHATYGAGAVKVLQKRIENLGK